MRHLPSPCTSTSHFIPHYVLFVSSRHATNKLTASDRVIFQLLQGEIAPSKRTELIDLDKLLTTATLTISISAILSDGRHEEERSYTVPLRTTAFGYIAHLSIRNETGSYVDYLGSSGTYEIVTECQILSQFLKTGMWTFKVVAELEDKTCLFEMTLTQRLEGRMK